jgi:hypothetical protein
MSVCLLLLRTQKLPFRFRLIATPQRDQGSAMPNGEGG